MSKPSTQPLSLGVLPTATSLNQRSVTRLHTGRGSVAVALITLTFITQLLLYAPFVPNLHQVANLLTSAAAIAQLCDSGRQSSAFVVLRRQILATD
jgi:hypothetical protein